MQTDGAVACWGSDSYGQATPPSGTFQQVSTGEVHTCGILTDGAVVCWGRGYSGEATPPSGTFRQISAGTCGVRTNGAVACWGFIHQDAPTPLSGTFQQVSTRYGNTCGVRTDGAVACWGTYLGERTPPSGTFQQVSIGEGHICGLRTDGTVVCWGGGYSGEATPPSGTFQQVSAGEGHTCGLQTDGTVVCWGYDYSEEAGPPTPEPNGPASDAPRFQQVSAGGYRHTCSVRTDGAVACWGNDYYGQATPPEGTFQQVSAGYEYTCGVRTDGAVACWGKDYYGQATPPEGTFQQVSAGLSHACGVRTDGAVACWGNDYNGQATPPEGTFQQVSVSDSYITRSYNYSYSCGVRTDGAVTCWGTDLFGGATPPSGTFRQVSVGRHHTCGVRTDRTVACWGSDSWGKATPPSGTFRQVSAGGLHTCGVRTDGAVACWGSGYYSGRATPPGTFQQVSAGYEYTCGVRTDGAVACWGDNDNGQATPPGLAFQQVSIGDDHTCGVRTGGAVACWGNNHRGAATPPSGTFRQVSSGWNYTCGVRTDGAVACWGSGYYSGRATPPGTFQQVSAGKYHACGVQTDGAIACWGSDYDGQATPPSGTFQQVSAGSGHTCGVRTDGAVACWGDDDDGQATPPSGTFQQVSAGSGHTCGVRTDGAVACWGYDRYGEATPPGGTFQQVSAGVDYCTIYCQEVVYYGQTCGVRTDGVVACWGGNSGTARSNWVAENVVATPPGRTFRQVSAGISHACGVETSGGIVCWGMTASRIVGSGGGTPPATGGEDDLTAPTNVVANSDCGQVTVTWTDGRGATSHEAVLFKSDYTGSPVSAPATGGSHVFSGVAAGNYVVAVLAYDAKGEYLHSLSNEVTVLDACEGDLTAPTNVVAEADCEGVTVTWTDGQGAASHLAVLFKSDYTGSPRVEPATGGSHVFSGVEGGSYTAAVFALDAEEEYLFSLSNEVTVAEACDACSGVDQRDALAGLHNVTNGRGWTRQTHWNSTNPIGEWHGVTTDAAGCITELELQNNNLVGIVPENLALLTELQMLRLEGNDLWGCLPRGETLKNAVENGRLKWVSDSGNRFASYVGDDEASLWEFVLFAAVLYAANEMGGTEGQRVAQSYLAPGLSLGLPPCAPRPPFSGKRVELRSQTTKTDAMALLDIYNYYVNYVDGNQTNPKDGTTKFDDGGGWGKGGKFMTYAEGAGSADCPAANPFEDIHGVGTAKFNGCHRVTSISFDKRGLYGSIPADFDRFGQLKYLNLSHNRLTEEIPPNLGNLVNLHTLALNNNYLTGEIPPHLGRLIGGALDGWWLLGGAVVLDLHLQENYLSGRVPPELANIGYLRTIRIDPQYYVQNVSRVRKDLEGCLPSNLELDIYGTYPKALTTLATKGLDKVREGVSILRTPSEKTLDAIAAEVLNTKRMRANRAHAVWGGMEIDDYNQRVRDMTGKTVEAGLGAARIADKQGFWGHARPFELIGFVATLEAIDYYAELIKSGLSFIEDRIADVLGTGDRDDVACGVYGGDAS